MPAFPIPQGWKVYSATDFGLRDAFANEWMARSPTGEGYFFEEYYYTGQDRATPVHAEAMLAKEAARGIHATVRLAELSRAAGVKRFLFSSSCIMYGMSEAAVVTEDSPLDPKTDYARSKVQSERAIAELAADHFSPTFLRNGTVYGPSPRMRFDTVLNDLVGAAVATRKVVVHSDGKPWRPVVHVRDVARAFLAVLAAPQADVHNRAFNTGADHLNHQIIELAELVVNTVPDSQLEIRAETGADQRTYKTDFSRFQQTFPAFRFEWTAKDGARALYHWFRAIGLTRDLFTDARYTRLKWLRSLVGAGRLDDSLRWSDSPGSSR